MRQNEIRMVDLDPAQGSKTNKRRPGIVVSNDSQHYGRTARTRRCHRRASDVEHRAQVTVSGAVAVGQDRALALTVELDEALRLHLAL